ncbi:FAD-dependent oxidoreductase [Streptomyces sp. NPDC060002]|uniref:FAD-dependent oxidoreductase n=1 Tax=Streptomyces sp. NPDC060002 TaxID=3347033 RepID=UPI00367744A1
MVVGGGIGGPAAAIGLRRIGWDVTVLERAPAFADVGAGILLHANGVRALDALGVGEAIRATVRPVYTGGTLTPDGRVLSRMDGAALERRLGTPVVGVLRADLHRVLREALPDGRVRTGVEVADVGGAGRDADLVVAADGLDSRRRAELFPRHPGAVYSGSTVLRAVTERPFHDPLHDLELTWGRGTGFGHIRFVDGRAEWHAVLTAPPGVRHRDPLAALRRYDAVRRRRGRSVARAARQAGRMGHGLTHPLAVALRNGVLRLAPSGATLRRPLRHADWTPPRLR